MKALKVIVKLIVALAAIAGAIYALATYGDKIVAWCKDLKDRLLSCKCCCEPDFEDIPAEETEDLSVEEAAVAEEADFEG